LVEGQGKDREKAVLTGWRCGNAMDTALVALACVDGAGSLVNIDVDGVTTNLS
jgi:hypothetical protein